MLLEGQVPSGPSCIDVKPKHVIMIQLYEVYCSRTNYRRYSSNMYKWVRSGKTLQSGQTLRCGPTLRNGKHCAPETERRSSSGHWHVLTTSWLFWKLRELSIQGKVIKKKKNQHAVYWGPCVAWMSLVLRANIARQCSTCTRGLLHQVGVSEQSTSG